MKKQVKHIAFVNNQISITNLEFAIRYLDIKKSELVIFFLRPNEISNSSEYWNVYQINKKYNGYFLNDLIRAFYSYITAIFYLKNILKNNNIENVLLVNIDHILTNHMINIKKLDKSFISTKYHVLAEGLMNYENVKIGHRKTLTIFLKHIIASFTGLIFKKPDGHLSGAYEKVVKNVFAFSKKSIQSPLEKVIVTNTVKKATASDKNNTLILCSGAYTMLSVDKYSKICDLIDDYLSKNNFDKVYLKKHPRLNDDPLIDRLMNFEEIEQNKPIEMILSEYPIKYVISSYSTSLISLKQMFNNLIAIDVGYDIYVSSLGQDVDIKSLYKEFNIKMIN